MKTKEDYAQDCLLLYTSESFLEIDDTLHGRVAKIVHTHHSKQLAAFSAKKLGSTVTDFPTDGIQARREQKTTSTDRSNRIVFLKF
jgi:hypothetical protein